MEMKNGVESYIWGVQAGQRIGDCYPAESAYVGVSIRGPLSVSTRLEPDEARELAAELIAAANLAEGGKA